MTKIIGLTGGIGSGKSTVAAFFAEKGIPVYIADDAAKAILDQPDVTAQVVAVFGSGITNGSVIDRRKLAAIVFDHPEKLAQLNAIVHPAVRRDFENWVAKHHDKSFVVKEAITVVAPEEIRIGRVMMRDGVGREEVLKRMRRQWTDAQKVALSDYVIENTDRQFTRRQVNEILKKLQKI
jgi:dephospho-CoA kinase